jgi:hypothetical protein
MIQNPGSHKNYKNFGLKFLATRVGFVRKFYRISRKAGSFIVALYTCRCFANFPGFLFLKDDLRGAEDEITVQKPDYVGMEIIFESSTKNGLLCYRFERQKH